MVLGSGVARGRVIIFRVIGVFFVVGDGSLFFCFSRFRLRGGRGWFERKFKGLWDG